MNFYPALKSGKVENRVSNFAHFPTLTICIRGAMAFKKIFERFGGGVEGAVPLCPALKSGKVENGVSNFTHFPTPAIHPRTRRGLSVKKRNCKYFVNILLVLLTNSPFVAKHTYITRP